jgi:hypothetical protein
MPLSYEQSAAEAARDSKVQEVTDSIDAKLLDGEYMRNNCMGNAVESYWDFVGKGELTEEEKALVKHAYLQAGWTNVTVYNSSEHSERGGLWCVKLTRNVTRQV